MIEKLIDEINSALDHNLFLAALAVALTLPDICGKAEYPEDGIGDRYKKWYKENIGQYECHPSDKPMQMPYLDENVVYSLRCCVLHEGNPNVEKEKSDIDNFKLVTEKKKNPEIYGDTSAITIDEYNGIVIKSERYYSVSVRRLCMIICKASKKYYEDNKDKFDFFKYTIEDRDKEIEKLKQLGWLES